MLLNYVKQQSVRWH